MFVFMSSASLWPPILGGVCTDSTHVQMLGLECLVALPKGTQYSMDLTTHTY